MLIITLRLWLFSWIAAYCEGQKARVVAPSTLSPSTLSPSTLSPSIFYIPIQYRSLSPTTLGPTFIPSASDVQAVDVSSSSSIAAPMLSKVSCQELGWTVTPTGVCLGSGDDCSLRLGWVASSELCESIGTRLCTSNELSLFDAQEGCTIDNLRVWTSTLCEPTAENPRVFNSYDSGGSGWAGGGEGVSASYRVSQAASSEYLGDVVSMCENKERQQNIRCCADVQSEQEKLNVSFPFEQNVSKKKCKDLEGWETDLLTERVLYCVQPCQQNECLSNIDSNSNSSSSSNSNNKRNNNNNKKSNNNKQSNAPLTASPAKKNNNINSCARVSLQSALNQCLSLGARLCSANELDSTLQQFPCLQQSQRQVWTRTTCANQSVYVVGGGGGEDGGEGDQDVECVPISRRYFIQCCAENTLSQPRQLPLLQQSVSTTTATATATTAITTPAAAAAATTTTQQACMELGWLGISNHTCITDRVIDGSCRTNVDYLLGRSMCSDLGARMCTASEIRVGFSGLSGCLSNGLVWSSETGCDFASATAISVNSSSTNATIYSNNNNNNTINRTPSITTASTASTTSSASSASTATATTTTTTPTTITTITTTSTCMLRLEQSVGLVCCADGPPRPPTPFPTPITSLLPTLSPTLFPSRLSTRSPTVFKTSIPSRRPRLASSPLSSMLSPFSPALTAPSSSPTLSVCDRNKWSMIETNKDVCIETKLDNQCRPATSWFSAVDLCSKFGARLCTVSELNAYKEDEGRQGCGNTRVWASDACSKNGNTSASVNMDWPEFAAHKESKLLTRAAKDSNKANCDKKSASLQVVCCGDSAFSLVDAINYLDPVLVAQMNCLRAPLRKSGQSCLHLGWAMQAPGVNVCSASKVFTASASSPVMSTPLNVSSVKSSNNKDAQLNNLDCSPLLSYNAAVQTCERLGARLCTSWELAQGVGQNTGCQLDLVRVWTQTPCSLTDTNISAVTNVTSVLTQGGGSDFADVGLICKSILQSSFPVKCCADIP